jgi:hypothetical protein
MTRISDKQRRALELIEFACRPQYILDVFDKEKRVIPFYSENLMPHYFNTWSERQRFIENLQKRGFIRIERSCFLYITDEGKELVTKGK